MRNTSNTSRRDILASVPVAGAAAALGGIGLGEARAAIRSPSPLKAAFSNAGLQSSWCAQGKAAAEYWGNLFNVEVTWFDGQLDAAKQRAAIEAMASQKWDFVAIQPISVSTLLEPVKKMIDAGITVIAMDAMIVPGGPESIGVYTLIRADNVAMGRLVTRALVRKLGGEGKIIMTQGPLDNTAAQDRTKGFNIVVKEYPGIEVLDTQPADWDVSKVAQQWRAYLAKYPQIDAAFFHSDDMALAAYEVMKAHGRTSILIGGIDAMPPALDAVLEGRMFVTMRNPACLIHSSAIIAGVTALQGGAKEGGRVPRRLVIDGPLVTFENAASMLWMQEQFLM
jgi:ribose transport system substrate-binding protein